MKSMSTKSMDRVYEEPLPPPERPLIIRDNRHTVDHTTDRKVLAKCLEDLTQRIGRALDDEYARNQRLARRIILENRLMGVTGKRYERFNVVLPIAASCWNDVNLIDVELRMIRAINEKVVDPNHIWYKVRILIDDFINIETKELLDRLDRGESISPENESPCSQNASPSHDSPVASTSTHKTNSDHHSKPQEPITLTIDDDDLDDDVIILD